MKENRIFTKKEKIIIIMILAILAFCFYWYSLRPYSAKRQCLEKADRFSKTSGQTFAEIYNNCLLRKGFK